MHVTTITKKKSHEFETEQERAYGRVWGKKGKGLMILKKLKSLRCFCYRVFFSHQNRSGHFHPNSLIYFYTLQVLPLNYYCPIPFHWSINCIITWIQGC